MVIRNYTAQHEGTKIGAMFFKFTVHCQRKEHKLQVFENKMLR
jgi:hypothetical protein